MVTRHDAVLAIALAILVAIAACSGGASPAMHDAAPALDASVAGDAAAPASDAGAPPDAIAPAGPQTCQGIALPPPPLACVGTVGSAAGREYCVQVPSTGTATPLPVVMLLHAFQESGEEQALYFGLGALVDARAFILVKPNGTTEMIKGKATPFWNAFPVCCDLASDAAPPDDVAYLDAVLADVASRYAVDAKRIYVIGHSNGGFMAHRYACDRASTVAAFISMEGGAQAADCHPSEPVPMVEIHGTADTTIPYDGGGSSGTNPSQTWPSVADTMALWAANNGCGATSSPVGDLDLTWQGGAELCGIQTDGAETEIEQFTCTGATTEHWKVNGGVHGPTLSLPNFPTQVLDFLFAHAKP